MNGESVFGWIKAGGVLLIAALLAFIVWKFWSFLKGPLASIANFWNNEKAALAAKQAIWTEKASEPPLLPGTIVSNSAGAATGIVLPMRRRATGTSIDAVPGSSYSQNSGFMDLYL